MCGDSTIKEDVDKLTDGKQADMIFTDPPYNVDYEGGVDDNGSKMKIQNDKQSDADFKEFLQRHLITWHFIVKMVELSIVAMLILKV